MIITTRHDLGKLFAKHFFTGIGAEIGVQNGWNSLQISKYWKGIILCVDIWPNPENYNQALENLEYKNVLLLKSDSVKVGQMLPDNSLDWVHIDGDHTYDGIKADYDTWMPKVRTGGVISFHDYGNNGFGVSEFINGLGIPFHLTTDDFWEGIEYQTAWFIKGEDKNLSEMI